MIILKTAVSNWYSRFYIVGMVFACSKKGREHEYDKKI